MKRLTHRRIRKAYTHSIFMRDFMCFAQNVCRAVVISLIGKIYIFKCVRCDPMYHIAPLLITITDNEFPILYPLNDMNFICVQLHLHEFPYMMILRLIMVCLPFSFIYCFSLAYNNGEVFFGCNCMPFQWKKTLVATISFNFDAQIDWIYNVLSETNRRKSGDIVSYHSFCIFTRILHVQFA